MNKRERYLDIAKGCGILSIVLLHFLPFECIGSPRTYMGLYMITIFYVIAGWIDAMRSTSVSTKDLIKKRWKQLGVPYVAWTIIILLFDCVLCLFGHLDSIIIVREIYKAVVLRGIGTLWFLPALFGGELLWNVVKKQKNIWLVIRLIGVTLFYNEFYYYMFGSKTDTLSRIIEAPFHTINNILNAFLFIAGGYLLCILYKRYENTCNHFIWGVLGAVICLFMYWWTYYVHIPIIGAKMVSLFVPFGIILISKLIQESRHLNYLNFWGIHSLGLMVTHYSLLLPVCVIIQNYIYHTDALRLHGWTSALYLLPVMILEYYLVLFVEKKYPKLLGK